VTRARHPAIALAVALFVGASARPASARAEDATALALQADTAHEAGQLGDAGELYARAYRAMTAEEKMALGEVVVAAALDDLRAAPPDPSRTALAGELLAEYERDVGILPDAIAEHRVWLSGSARSEDTDDPSADDPAPRAEASDPEPSRREAERKGTRREIGAPLAIGFGVAATLGGAALLAFGAPLGRRAEDARAAALEDPLFLALDEPDASEYREGYDDYVSHEKRRATAFAVTGAVLLTAGIGLAVYGGIRLARHRRGPSEHARVRAIAGGIAF
jgi:hypothetical protein